MIKIAINGFGRIGRPVFRRILDKHPNLEIVAINDLTDAKTLAHLLKYDSVYGKYENPLPEDKVLAEKDPAKLPWGKMEVDVVLECTGLFTKIEDAQKHLSAGAKKVIISAPSKSEAMPHFVLGVNQENYNPEKDNIVSMASCTTNCLAPIANILHQEFEIESGLMTAIHSYTNDQKLLDSPHRKDLRRARSAALSMVPTTTGAAIAVIKTIPELKGKIHGLAIRVPTPVVSLVDFVAKVKKETDVEGINIAFKKASEQDNLKGILRVEESPLVSVDYKGSSFSAIVDAASTMVQEKKLVKVLAWYDNEYGYACRLAEFAEFIGKKL
ncbi:MAG: glyceraldehyde-3-phosphate dehydrogenase [Firmicutes bacterium ML8_F2]|jgi:glyceraldehyde 3-phosphate dehydrogenase|nr:MAG: glyceraldehyde-3-phosphate dehydrogenase [Firmicutes bacterium ML8_F2]